MTPELPQIAVPADRRAVDRFGEDIGGILVLLAYVLERGDPQVDLARPSPVSTENARRPGWGWVGEYDARGGV